MINRKKAVFILFSLLSIYAVWNARNLLLGPRIDIVEPQNGQTISINPLTVNGIIKNASFISMNGYRIYTDKEGVFSEEVGLYSGYNIISIVAQDRFGEDVTKELRIYYDGESPVFEEDLLIASTTTATSTKNSNSTEENLLKLEEEQI